MTFAPEDKQYVDQAVQQAAQAAAQAAASQAASQAAQQVAEQVAQQVSQAVQKMLQTSGGVAEGALGARTTSQAATERAEDIGGGEAHESGLNVVTHAFNANIKRTYDEYQHESLESIKRNRSYVDKVLSDAQAHDNRTRQIAEQALQNAVETANMIGKQAVAHRDIAIHGEWEPVEQGAANTLTARSVTLDDASLKAIAASVANVLSQTQPKTA